MLLFLLLQRLGSTLRRDNSNIDRLRSDDGESAEVVKPTARSGVLYAILIMSFSSHHHPAFLPLTCFHTNAHHNLVQRRHNMGSVSPCRNFTTVTGTSMETWIEGPLPREDILLVRTYRGIAMFARIVCMSHASTRCIWPPQGGTSALILSSESTIKVAESLSFNFHSHNSPTAIPLASGTGWPTTRATKLPWPL
jgi:hypothetical protein